MLPHLKRVATLPCEISVQKIPRSVPCMGISQYPVYWFFLLKNTLWKRIYKGF